MKNNHRAFELVFFFSQIVIIIIYAFTTEYSSELNPLVSSVTVAEGRDKVQQYYPLFQDVHVMIFVGFGFLMVFLKTHCWTSVGFNFLIAAFALEWTIPVQGFMHMAVVEGGFPHKVQLDIPALIMGDFGAGAVLITFGAVLGKVSIMQMWTIAFFEIIFYSLNEAICAGKLVAVDMGGSMYVHTFGAYFGVAACFFFQTKKAGKDEFKRCEGGYYSQLIAMVGTLFLWMFWPSFNGALANQNQQQRVIINTVLSIAASCITACGLSRLYFQRLDMEVVLNATLAGGVSVGSSSDLVVTGAIAMVIGSLAGLLSAAGFIWIGPFLKNKINMHDTCGVHNLHGMPGVLGGIIGAISASASSATFNDASLLDTFSAMKPPPEGEGRSPSEQGWIQAAALGITLGISIFGGAFTGFVASRCCNPDVLFDDEEHWRELEWEDPLTSIYMSKHFVELKPLEGNNNHAEDKCNNSVQKEENDAAHTKN